VGRGREQRLDYQQPGPSAKLRYRTRDLRGGSRASFQIGAQESGPEFGNQLLNSVTFASEAMPAEVTVEPGLAACPVGAFMGLC